MISVRCLGHIGTSVGREEIMIPAEEISASDLVERVRAESGKSDPGFSRFNTLVMIEDGEAFVAAGSSRQIHDGAKVVLIPFSHGG
jgi:molybdopterin converting factor small subunit